MFVKSQSLKTDYNYLNLYFQIHISTQSESFRPENNSEQSESNPEDGEYLAGLTPAPTTLV